MKSTPLRTSAQALAEPSFVSAFELDLQVDSIDSLAAASPETLQTIMLSRMNAVANLKRDIGFLVAQLAEQLADAKLAEMILHQKKARGNGGSR